MPDHRVAHLRRYHESGSRARRPVRPIEVYDEGPRRATGTAPGRRRELRRGTQAKLGRQHRRARRQADSASRPLRRRAARIARPARVRIRNRKPCTLARLRLFGWKVRLLTVGLSSRSTYQAGDHRVITVRVRRSLSAAPSTPDRANVGGFRRPPRGHLDRPNGQHRWPTRRGHDVQRTDPCFPTQTEPIGSIRDAPTTMLAIGLPLVARPRKLLASRRA